MRSEKLFYVIGASISYLSIFVITVVTNGFVFSKVWQWFIVPVFNFEPLNIPQAIGVYFVISYATKTIKPSEETQTGEEWLKRQFHAVLIPLTALLTAWILSYFV